MFAQHDRRSAKAAAEAKLQRMKHEGNWRKHLLEDGESVPLPSVSRQSNEERVSKAAVAARSAFIRVVVDAAKARHSEAPEMKLEELVKEAFDSACSLLKPYIGRGKVSQHNATTKLMGRAMVSGAVSRSISGVNVSLVSILREAKAEYTRKTGIFPSMTTMPNFIRHLGSWVSCATFQGEVKEKPQNMLKFVEKEVESGDTVLVEYTASTGSVFYITGVYTEEKYGAGKGIVVIKRITTEMKWFDGDVARSGNPVGFGMRDEGDRIWRVTSDSGMAGKMELLGVQTQETMVYHPMWLDAFAIPPTRLERAMLLTRWWSDEVVKRRNQLLSAATGLAQVLAASFAEHSLSWFMTNKVMRAINAKPEKNPFHGVAIEEWAEVTRLLESAGTEVAMSLIRVDAGGDNEKVTIDLDGASHIWSHIFLADGDLITWKKFIQMRRALIKADKAAGKTVEKVGPEIMTDEEERETVTRIQERVAQLRSMTDNKNMPSIKLALRGITQLPSAGGYIAQENGEVTTTGFLAYVKRLNLSNDVDSEVEHNQGVELVRMWSQADDEEQEKPVKWEDLAGTVYEDDEDKEVRRNE